MLWVTHPLYFEHRTGTRHPECPARLTAVLSAATDADVVEALVPIEPVPRRGRISNESTRRRTSTGSMRYPRPGADGSMPTP